MGARGPGDSRYDCLIVGGGPAGLSAALVLGRCRRRVLVCDAGAPRNVRTVAVHGFLTRDGIAPHELLQLARAELASYDGVELRCAEVIEAICLDQGFAVVCRDGARFVGRTLLLATGVVDELPPLEGLRELYGTSVHHCPYCDAWEWRDQPLAVYGIGEAGAKLALSLTLWSRDVVLCSNGPAGFRTAMRRRLAKRGVVVREDPIVRLEGREGFLDCIVFAAGAPLPRRALFFASGQHQHSPLPRQLGCRFNSKGTVAVGLRAGTNIPGVYVVGDASKEVQFVVVAAAEGAAAAVSINTALLKEDLHKPIAANV